MDRDRIRVSIAGGSGYAGGELLRLLLAHPAAAVAQVTSETHAGRPVGRCHPHLRRHAALTFCAAAELEPCDLLFLCLPHGQSSARFDRLSALAPRLVDLGADFRLKDPAAWRAACPGEPPRPEQLARFVYGLPELHREEMRTARWVSSAGCNATAVILALHPLFRHGVAERDRTVVEVKVGSTEGGHRPSEASHHPERSRCVRSYKPTGHRHALEIAQELGGGDGLRIHFSATAVELVRGVLATCHVFLDRDLAEKDVWSIYRRAYAGEPFVRLVREREGPHRFPEPKVLTGSNFCDIGFELDPAGRRLVVLSALDNLMKGAAGQAVQAFNLMNGLPETTGLEFPGLHPV
jgi:N-acetyl-gamma-glutamyl-phosphate/LysW-gamma-L-alpha-aminoadipyl-6-phosphate reductase